MYTRSKTVSLGPWNTALWSSNIAKYFSLEVYNFLKSIDIEGSEDVSSNEVE